MKWKADEEVRTKSEYVQHAGSRVVHGGIFTATEQATMFLRGVVKEWQNLRAVQRLVRHARRI